MNFTNISLLVILVTVLLVPFLFKKIEKELEIFLFVMGCLALSLTAQWNGSILREALIEPVKITLAVLFAGILFKFLQKPIARNVGKALRLFGLRWFIFLVITGLGILSSVITAIVASLILVEIISCLKLDRITETRIVVLACFSIGLGAAITPIGEPLSTIVIAKLKGYPYQADFFFIARVLGAHLIAGVMAFGVFGMLSVKPGHKKERGLLEDRREATQDIFIRTGKVYLFIMALIFLGASFKPVIDTFISKIPYRGLYWINMTSAILDNATLASAQVGSSMHMAQIKAALLGLLISGGMLIPGNIPNIIAAGKLKIKSSEWAKFGVPPGLVALVIYFLLLR
ncbi:MAG: DUF1646 family protein [Candidatus Omnitrophica bacterium]|jgi:predicted cation transporter|nr:DUF1646 family protein [Candidatus Omnitrophota bacterium]